MNDTTLDAKLDEANHRIQRSIRLASLRASLGLTPDFEPLPPFPRARRRRPLFEAADLVQVRAVELQLVA